ncbi:hypothetical protein EWM64_g4430 [Hericium alpestre]|uniref:BTB domain-containing protein n=1 Tax=Hericium alpestre TaxID=135208 RepID=A0A4Y9ZYI1_9AGAM|nr:hypothetical protein EWM64_g4430 [Hericium alpestre]
MFSLPNSDAVSETYDGVPLVRMPDVAEDLEKLLEALYCSPSLTLVPFSPHNPTIARPVLALSTKYEIAHLRTLIVDRLEADWPLTLDQWDELQYTISIWRKYHIGPGRIPSPFIDDFFPEPASAICLARDFNIPKILPVAFYHLLRVPITNDWDPLHEESPRGEIDSAPLCGARTAKLGLLRAEELLIMLRGRHEFLVVFGEAVDAISVNAEHPDPDRCSIEDSYKGIGDLKEDCETALQSHENSDDIFTLLLPESWAKEKAKWNMCSECKSKIVNEVEGVRRALWDLLPQIFGLAEEMEPDM